MDSGSPRILVPPQDAKEIGQALSLLSLVNRVTLALSGAAGKAEATESIAAILTSPLGLRFSRAFCFEFDDWRECFIASLAVGVASDEEAEALTRRMAAEEALLNGFSRNLAEQSEPGQLMGHLKAGSLWAQSIHRIEGSLLLIDGWLDLQVFPKSDSNGGADFVAHLQADPSPRCFCTSADLAELPHVLRANLKPPFAAFGIRTTKGVRMIVLVDRAFQRDSTISESDLALLDWFRSQAAVIWANAELYADLEASLGRLREIDALKTSFLGTISHELRTPLTTVLGFLELILSNQAGPLPDQQRRLLDRTQRQADHLLGLVNDLIELAQSQAEGIHRLAPGPVVVHHVLRSALSRLAAGPRSSQMQIAIPDRDAEPCLVAAHDAALERILYHLLDNAVKFSAPGDRIDVSFHLVDDNWHIAIADPGIGIDRSHLRNIFRHFYQIDARLSRAYPGMGIGLTLVRILLEATGGHILVESELGQGSVFTVVYPRWREKA
jgi:signal transduction histidine kinase